MQLTTRRLVLREWDDTLLPLVADITSDPEVMRFFLSTRDRAQSDAWVERTQAHFARTGFGIWAIAAPGVAPLIGFCGLATVPDTMPCAPAVEIAWTFGRAHWRQGYATEAARAAIDDGFGRIGLREIVAFTATVNEPSRAVMRGLGMVHDPASDFLHPRLPDGHRLKPHVLYRILAPGRVVC